MVPALLILLPVILAIFLTGGISIKSPGSESYGQSVTLSEGILPGIFNALQINSLVQGTPAQIPTPTVPPGATSTPVPTVAQGPTATAAPVATTRPVATNPPGIKTCTANPDCSAAGVCPSSRFQNCTMRGPQPCTPVQAVVSCTYVPPPPRCIGSAGVCELHRPNCSCPGNTLIQCSNGQCVGRSANGSPSTCSYSDHSFCSSCNKYSGDGTYCFAKPVIYLYPLKVTRIDVSIETTGQIVISDPLYPEGGWKKVEAHPDGTLYYQGEKYRELFYETNVHDFNKPENGIVIKTEDLESMLDSYITKLGLTKAEERIEFLDWWLPRLRALNSPYILFSVLDFKEKAKTDKVNISPKPDSFIEFIAYFKPLSKSISIPLLVLPSTPPERVGFTAIEWGGVIDDK